MTLCCSIYRLHLLRSGSYRISTIFIVIAATQSASDNLLVRRERQRRSQYRVDSYIYLPRKPGRKQKAAQHQACALRSMMIGSLSMPLRWLLCCQEASLVPFVAMHVPVESKFLLHAVQVFSSHLC